ncbi:MAG: RING finger domain-containing protein [Candidatus Babeliales bacterium]|nr:RING finger domain-containing protein [Candidatus Babeliales bacterium]
MKKSLMCVSLFFILSVPSIIYTKSVSQLLHSGTAPEVVDNILDLSNLNLSDLRGIDAYPDIESVQKLILSDNKLKSINPLSTLSKYNIKVIDLASNAIQDLTPLIGLKALQELNVEDNNLSEQVLLYILKYLKKLQRLIVNGNPIENHSYEYYRRKYKHVNYLDVYNYPVEEEVLRELIVEERAQALAQDEAEDEMPLSIIRRRSLNLNPGHEELHGVILNKLSNPTQDQFCRICLDEGEEDENGVKNENAFKDLYLTPCQHIFHKACLRQWFLARDKKKANCPTCRLKFRA